MNQDFKIIVTIILTIIIVMATTLLFELPFIKKLLIRQMLIYVVLLIEIFIGARLVLIFKRQ